MRVLAEITGLLGLLEIFGRYDCFLSMLGATVELDLVVKLPSHLLDLALLVHDQAAGAATWKALQRQTVEVVGPETGMDNMAGRM